MPFRASSTFPVLLALLLSLGACANRQDASPAAPAAAEQTAQGETAQDFDFDDYDDHSEASDPLGPWNRVWFSVNDKLMRYAIHPVYRGYAFVVPEKVRGGISQFRENLKAPVRFVNHLLQGEFAQAGVEFGRFLINSCTSLGFADVASQSKPLYPYYPQFATFSHTLGVWGVHDGPFVVWPLFGPNTLRGSAGDVTDIFFAPQTYCLDWEVSVPVTAGLMLNDFGDTYQAYTKLTDTALEPYSAVRNAWMSLSRAADEQRKERRTGFSMRLSPDAISSNTQGDE